MAIPTPTYYWKFDASSGSSASEEQSGNTINFNSAPNWVAGVVGNAVQLNGSINGEFNIPLNLGEGV